MTGPATAVLDHCSLDKPPGDNWLEIALERLHEEGGSQDTEAPIATFNAAF